MTDVRLMREVRIIGEDENEARGLPRTGSDALRAGLTELCGMRGLSQCETSARWECC